MKHITHISCICAIALLASCSNDEPDYSEFMQPAAITTNDAGGYNQMFAYDEYGRIADWYMKSNNPNDASTYTARYSYPDRNTIHVVSEDSWGGNKRCYEEDIRLVNGRASRSEGTFVSYIRGNVEIKKTYILEYGYDDSNHLAIVKHSEVVGIGDEVKDGAWDKPWTWENHYIWEGSNLKEYQDYQGKSTVNQTTKYDYTTDIVAYPIVVPTVICFAHHTPLVMQGAFGLNPVNPVKSAIVIDRNGDISMTRQYTYKFEQSRIIEYTETDSHNTGASTPIIYMVKWTYR